MKNLILITIILGAMLHPSFAGGRHVGNNGGFHGWHGGHSHFNGRRGYFHGDRHGWRGGYYFGEIIFADDGCFQWDGYSWVVIDCD